MSTYDRHIIRRLAVTYLLLVAGLIVFFIVLHYVEYVDDFMDRGATMRDVFTVYYPNYIPEIVRLISPLAIFLATVYLTAQLAQKRELSSLQTTGVSLYRLMRPYVIVGLTLTLFMLWFNGWIVPHTNQVRITFEQEYTKDGARGIDAANIHRQESVGSILSMNYYDRSSKNATTVSLQRFDDRRKLVERVDAARMVWIDSTMSWVFTDVTIRKVNHDGLISRSTVSALDTTLSIRPRDLARSQGDVDMMTVPEAKEYIATLRRTGATRLGRPLVAFYSKYAYPFSNLILILIGVPMAAVRRRGGQAVQIGLGLFVAFVYLSAMKLTEPFGYAGTISPSVAAWAPHIFFLIGALVFLYRVRK